MSTFDSNSAPPRQQVAPRREERDSAMTARLLRGGAVAAPLYAVTVLVQASVRDGYHLTRHPASMLANGPGGWVQTLNFVVCGLLMIGAGVGTARALHGHPSGTWAPRLMVIQGTGLVAAAAFRLDPADGFLGTPVGPPSSFSWHAIVHNQVGTVLFLAMIVCCFVLARHFTGGWRRLGPISGAAFAAAIVWTYSGGALGGLTLFLGVVIAWGWISGSLAQISRTGRQDLARP